MLSNVDIFEDILKGHNNGEYNYIKDLIKIINEMKINYKKLEDNYNRLLIENQDIINKIRELDVKVSTLNISI